ncbi:MAG TPA: hypothetical protein VNC60_06700 [Actinomycetota bacterium]|nr:hypothetical protein [Actinomycetota bacterium]
MGGHAQHADHIAGTVSDCRACTSVAYEPSWYASLLIVARALGADRIGAAQIVST